MITDETALVFALPDDTAESLMKRVRATHAANVQILAPEGTVALQRVADTDMLRDLAQAAGIGLTIISSDPQILKAARQSRLATIEVTGAHVQPPPPPPPPSPAEDLPAEDLEFLAALDELTAGGRNIDLFASSTPPTKPAGAETRPVAAPETRPVSLTSEGPAAMGDDDLEFFDALDDLAAAFEQERTGAPPPPISMTRRTEEPSPRIRPEDIQLSDEEIARAGQIGQRSSVDRSQRTAAATQRESWRMVTPTPSPSRTATPLPSRRTIAPLESRLFRVLLGLLIVIVVLAGILLVVTQSVTIVVRLPVQAETPIVGLAIPLVPVTATTSGAVAAEPIETTVAISIRGEVTEGVLTPISSAAGTVTLLNLNAQPITIPAGSEFVAFGSNNQPIPFISTTDVTIPGATTTRSGNQIITTLGEASVPIEARSPGSASNIAANTIRELRIPGGPTIDLTSGVLTIRHDAIGGGTDEEVRVIKESDVRRYLAQALTDLDQEARRQLDGLAIARNLQLEPTIVSPSRAELEQLAGFELIVDPPVGTSLPRDNPFFTITVQSRYSGLAVRSATTSFQRQLADAFNAQLIQNAQLRPGTCRAAFIQGWRWDGTTLRVDGGIGPDPACGNELDPATRAAIQNAVLGRTRAEAEAALRELVANGRLAGFELPDGVEQFPGWSWQLRIRHE